LRLFEKLLHSVLCSCSGLFEGFLFSPPNSLLAWLLCVLLHEFCFVVVTSFVC
jgi:hypothetical protein